ncbi:MAG TPA: hemolysin family protein [Gemmatimonadaceae bacterium]|nr:hemolysin family protein [Gemmatimonadaceae bacterium]
MFRAFASIFAAALAPEGQPAGTGEVVTRLLIVLALVIVNAFFVAAEFALVATKRSRIENRAAAGERSARLVEKTLKDLDHYISVTQVGITLASLALGWLGEDAIASLIDGGLSRLGLSIPEAAVHTTAAAIAAFIVIAFLHVVLGQLTPKSLALVRPERMSAILVRPLIGFSVIMSPFIALMNGAANGVLRLFGVRASRPLERVHSPEELRLLVMQSRAQGALDESDSAMLAGVFDFHEKRARDVMRPRTDIVAVPVDATESDVSRLMRSERYSRYPVYEETLDNVVGVLVAKDVWLKEPGIPFELRSLIRKPLYVPDNRPAERVLDDLRRSRAHMAVVLDEYGGTAGIVTLEDLVEEVIGDINDEYDFAVREAIEANGVLELAGSMSLVDVRSDYRLPIPDGDWTTLGGYTFARLGRVPRIGDRAQFPGGELEVVAMDGRRVAAVRVVRVDDRGRRRTPVTVPRAPSAAPSSAPPPPAT